MKKIIIAVVLFFMGLLANGQSVTTAYSLDSIHWENKSLEVWMDMYVVNDILFDKAGDVPLGIVKLWVENGEKFCVFYPYVDDECNTHTTCKERFLLTIYPAWMDETSN